MNREEKIDFKKIVQNKYELLITFNTLSLCNKLS
jgi:hypothetical protein